MDHKAIHVFGRVQGVGFRFAAKKMAQSLGLKGYVKNLADGSVYIEVEGNSEKLIEFIHWCNRGPSYAYIADLKINDGEVKGYNFFDIKY